MGHQEFHGPAGCSRRLSAGVYIYFVLGQRTLHKIIGILHPLDLWGVKLI
jgi:hypothetical protein